MNLKPLKYRDKALAELKEHFFWLLEKAGSRHKIVFKAPTGAGKTVSMACLMNDLARELPQRHDLGGSRQIAWVWLAPNQLHLQSFESLRRFFDENGGAVRAIQFDGVQDHRLRPNECLFLNWQSVSSMGNLFRKDNEQGKFLDLIFENTRLDGIEIVAILDEAHLFGTKGEKALTFLSMLAARLEMDVTATPLTDSEFKVVVPRHKVVAEQMIKKGVHLNPQLDTAVQAAEQDADLLLLEKALEKRDELAKRYRDAGERINPLLLIQLPSDTQKLTDEDQKIRQKITKWLDEQRGISVQTKRLAVWLSASADKLNLDGLEKFDSQVDVLLFKQAISLGWDCPRAAVLLIYREMRQESFTVQTLGRILRMPQQRHYADEALNFGYVFTNLQARFIQIQHDETDYISLHRSLRKAIYQPLELQAWFSESHIQRNRLGLDFKKALFEVASEMFGLSLESALPDGFFHENAQKLASKNIRLDVQEIEIELPTNVFLTDEIADEESICLPKQVRFAKTSRQIGELFDRFCLSACGDYQKDGSWERVKYHSFLLLNEHLGLSEKQAYKTVLANEQAFRDLLALARDRYAEHQAKKATGKTGAFKTQIWEVPEFRIYNENYAQFDVEQHILEPLFLRKRPGGKQLADSDTEFYFIQFLEENHSHIAWWYKNGAGGRGDFAVLYQKSNGEQAPFFPDFLMLFNNGTLGFFDTKTLASDPEMVAKHNSIFQYALARRAAGKPTLGGIVVPFKGSWRFPKTEIERGDEATGWTVFNPALL